MNWITKDRIAWILLGVFVFMQFIRIDKTPSPTDPAKDFLTITTAPENVAVMIKDACYDCHANTTTYPWYSNIAPVSWWLRGHIKGGRKHLNFSVWGDYDQGKRKHKIEECIESQEDKWMPLASYTWTHPEAKLSDEDRKVMVDWLKSQL